MEMYNDVIEAEVDSKIKDEIVKKLDELDDFDGDEMLDDDEEVEGIGERVEGIGERVDAPACKVPSLGLSRLTFPNSMFDLTTKEHERVKHALSTFCHIEKIDVYDFLGLSVRVLLGELDPNFQRLLADDDGTFIGDRVGYNADENEYYIVKE
jgi:hypothetical protein